MKLTDRNLINLWLKYHDTTLDEVESLHPEWMVNPKQHTQDFYDKYAVTQDQHDEWYDLVIDIISKKRRLSKGLTERLFVFSYLNVAPIIKT